MNSELQPISRQKRTNAAAFFNAAGVGLPSEESLSASLEPGGDWDAVLTEVRSHFSHLLGMPEEHVTLFHNTTAGIQRVFLRISQLLRSRNAVLLTTDLEYPGTVAMVDECWQGPMIIAEVAHLLWEGRCAEVTEVLKAAFLRTRPAVIYISHVARAFGYPVDLEFLRFAKEINPGVLIVADGAQAIGNIPVGRDVLGLVDFYVTSGHKWLCGKPTLGLVCADPRWHIPDQAQAYSRLSGSGGTGNLETLCATAVALRDFHDVESGAGARSSRIHAHNADLAALFCDLLEQAQLPLSPLRCLPGNRASWPVNGIVAVQGDLARFSPVIDTSGDLRRLGQTASEGRVLAAHVQREPWVVSRSPGHRAPRALAVRRDDHVALQAICLRDDVLSVPIPDGGLLRFCFHYFHASEDVIGLVRLLKSAA